MNKPLLTIPALAIFIAISPSTSAQKPSYPDRPIRLVLPSTPGGGLDMLARSLAQRISKEFGQTIVVDNRPGAGGIVGVEAVVRAAPDGYTMLYDSSSYVTRAATSELSFDAVTDITPISSTALAGYLIASHPSVPAKSVQELVALAKTKPGGLNYGSSGVGGFIHLATELFMMTMNIRMNHVPYKGPALALNDLVGGHVNVVLASFPSAGPHIKAGRIRALAVATANRWTAMPDVPALSETVPGYQTAIWYGVFGPKNLPKEIVARWNFEVHRISALPEMREIMAREGIEPLVSTPQAFEKTIRTDVATWKKVARNAGIQSESR